MEAPRSSWSAAPAVFGLALAQQLLFLLISSTAGIAPVPAAGAPRDWGVTTIFVLGSALLNTAFYCATWFGMLGAGRVAGRLGRVYLLGMAAGLFFFALASALTAQIDPKGPFGSYAQMAVLVATLASAFKLDDARNALGPGA